MMGASAVRGGGPALGGWEGDAMANLGRLPQIRAFNTTLEGPQQSGDTVESTRFVRSPFATAALRGAMVGVLPSSRRTVGRRSGPAGVHRRQALEEPVVAV
jgi:hypothetical protein